MIRTLALSAILLCACHPGGDDVGPDDSRAAAVHQGQVVTIDLGNTTIDEDQILAIARHTESLGDVAQAKVKVKKTDVGTSMELELWGENLPGEAELSKDLLAAFPALADADIEVTPLGPKDAGSPTSDLEQELAGEDPAVVEQAIEDRLRAQGVDGDIQVNVEDGEDGRTVDVRVEKKCDPAAGDTCD